MGLFGFVLTRLGDIVLCCILLLCMGLCSYESSEDWVCFSFFYGKSPRLTSRPAIEAEWKGTEALRHRGTKDKEGTKAQRHRGKEMAFEVSGFFRTKHKRLS